MSIRYTSKWAAESRSNDCICIYRIMLNQWLCVQVLWVSARPEHWSAGWHKVRSGHSGSGVGESQLASRQPAQPLHFDCTHGWKVTCFPSGRKAGGGSARADISNLLSTSHTRTHTWRRRTTSHGRSAPHILLEMMACRGTWCGT